MSNDRKGAAQAAPTLDKLAEQIRARMEKSDRTALAYALEIGAMLNQAKPQVPRGHWETWVKETLGMPRFSAARNMRLASNVSRVAHCKTFREAEALLRHPSKPKQPTEPKPKKPKPTLAGKRRHAVKMGRAEAKRNGRAVAFWELGWEVSRLVYGLASWHVETIPLDEDNRHAMVTVEEDLLYLYDWMDDTLSFIHSRMGEDGMRRQLGKLRAKTVENGCTPEEADAARHAAERLQRKINNVLVAVS